MKPNKLISSFLIAALGLAMAGCSNISIGKETTTTTSLERPITMGETYTSHKKGQTFYCVRLSDRYYMFRGSSGHTVTSDKDELLPKLEEGQFARVTADLEEISSSFGFYPMTIKCEITKLTSVEEVEFEDMTRRIVIPHADTVNENNMSQLFQYTKDGELYLIILYHDMVAAYTKEGRFIIYEREMNVGCFEKFFKAVGE